MNTTALIPHPRFSTASPIVTARELMLAAACLGLKAQVIEQAAKIAALEERNRQLIKAIHRTACGGHALPEVCGLVALVGIAFGLHRLGGGMALSAYVIGFGAALAWVFLLLIRQRDRHVTTPRRREHPAHIDEPAHEARIIDAIRRAPEVGLFYTPEDRHVDQGYESLGAAWARIMTPKQPTLGEAYAEDDIEFEPFGYHPLTRAINGPAAQEARARFEATAAALR